MTQPRPVAVLDIGSNTVRLYIGKVEAGTLIPLHDDSAFVRLGLDVDASGLLRADRQDAAVQAIVRQVALAHEWGAGVPLAVATSAVRDAANGAQFVERVRAQTGVVVQVLSGEREAELTFLGATLGRTLREAAIVVDVGGGSAEVISAGPDGFQWGRSLQLGSGRLTQRFIKEDPPSRFDLEEITVFVRSALATLPPASSRTGIFTGGTASQILTLLRNDRAPATITADELEHLVDMVVGTSKAILVQRFPIKPERANVLAAGMWILRTIAQQYNLPEMVITRTGIREGVVVDELRRHGIAL